jgi:hypothetical protein
MKALLFALSVLSLAPFSRAGIASWWTSKECDWQFIQSVGGIRVSAPVQKLGMTVLPVEVDVSGTEMVTRKPDGVNSALAVRRIDVSCSGRQIVIRIVRLVVDKDTETGPIHYASLAGIPPGTYEVFYGDANDPSRRLGSISISASGASRL